MAPHEPDHVRYACLSALGAKYVRTFLGVLSQSTPPDASIYPKVWDAVDLKVVAHRRYRIECDRDVVTGHSRASACPVHAVDFTAPARVGSREAREAL